MRSGASETKLRVYHPGPKFDDLLSDLARWLSDRAIALPGSLSEDLARAAEAERLESGEDARRMGEAERGHDAYVVARHERHDVFQKVLAIARGLARANPEMLRELKRFQVRGSRHSTAPGPSNEAPREAATDAA